MERGAWSVELVASLYVEQGMVNGKINNGELGVFIFPRDVGEKGKGRNLVVPLQSGQLPKIMWKYRTLLRKNS